MSAVSGIAGGYPPSPFVVSSATPAKTVAGAAAATDSDGDNDGSRPGEVESGKGTMVNRYA